MAQVRAKIAALFWPRFCPFLDKLNRNALVSKWIKDNKTAIPTFADKRDLHAFINKEVCRNEPVDYLEFGVYQGAAIRMWSEINQHPDSRFIGFDSFVGLPEHWTSAHGTGAFDLQGNPPSIADPRVCFVKGWFQETLRPTLQSFRPKSRLVIHNDSDLYSSTLYVLATLDPWIVPGTILIFDEYCVALHEFRAFSDYTGAFNRRTTPLAMTADFATQVAFRFDA